MTYYVPQRHYYILHYSYNKHGKTKKVSIKVPRIDIMNNKYVIFRNRYNHDITINLDKVSAIEEVTEERSFSVIAIAFVLLMLLIALMF